MQLCKDAEKPCGTVRVFLCDSQVVVGSCAKGRSSSYRLNGILRSTLGYMIISGICAKVIWVDTHSNRGDFPSRCAPLPPPEPIPLWARDYFLEPVRTRQGLELFSQTGMLSQACVLAGIPMLPMWCPGGSEDLERGIDWLGRLLEGGLVLFVFIEPPSSSFSPLRNRDRGGGPRPGGKALGLGNDLKVESENLWWATSCRVASKCQALGIPFFLKYPRRSRAWKLAESSRLRNLPGVKSIIIDQCMLAAPEARHGRGSTLICSNAPWGRDLSIRYNKSCSNRIPLGVTRTREALAYHHLFCERFAALASANFL